MKLFQLVMVASLKGDYPEERVLTFKTRAEIDDYLKAARDRYNNITLISLIEGEAQNLDSLNSLLAG